MHTPYSIREKIKGCLDVCAEDTLEFGSATEIDDNRLFFVMDDGSFFDMLIHPTNFDPEAAMRDAYNQAIDFAIEETDDAGEFLRIWRIGDFDRLTYSYPAWALLVATPEDNS